MFASNGRSLCNRQMVVAPVLVAVLVILGPFGLATDATACPFCTTPGPTLTQRREASAVVALAEFVGSQSSNQRFRVHRVLKGNDRVARGETLELPLAIEAKSGSLFLLFASAKTQTEKRLNWSTAPVNETSYAYFARSPSRRQTSAERLRYFAKHLASTDPLVSQDAYLEFAHATFLEVAQVADNLPMTRIRDWIISEEVSPQWRGFLGLALGLAATADQRELNRKTLHELIVTPADDFRVGFDGILGGYLLLAGEAGLELIERRILANPEAADGDVRHAMTALRFYHQYGSEISARRRSEALAHLLDREEFAAAAIADLSRSAAWDLMPRIADLFSKSDYPQPQTRRAVIGYFLACPTEKAAHQLANLRRQYPQQVAEAEEFLSFSGITR